MRRFVPPGQLPVRRILAAMMLVFALSACATRGAMDFTCRGFSTHVRDLPRSSLVEAIQSDTEPGNDLAGSPVSMLARDSRGLTGDPMTEAMSAMITERAAIAGPSARDAPAKVLLLSGGGQWGAFGSAFLDELNRSRGPSATDYGVITGVSTGAVQALFVAVNNRAAYEALLRAYTPESENEIVDRHGVQALAILTGSIAGLKPLRRRFESALCLDGDPAKGCDLISGLAGAARPVFVGFVEARTGKFVYADARAIADAGVNGPHADLANAQQCLTAVAMASAAMPVFYQQVRINGATYFDGGVRKSVFEAGVAATLDRATAVAAEKGLARGSEPELYVMRNGPTRLLDKHGMPAPEPTADGTLSALDAALRAEAIVVNELEVGSIAALRLARPTGKLFLVTADGYNTWPLPDGSTGCSKDEKAMFDPAFMLCLQTLGRLKADREHPWIELGELAPP